MVEGYKFAITRMMSIEDLKVQHGDTVHYITETGKNIGFKHLSKTSYLR